MKFVGDRNRRVISFCCVIEDTLCLVCDAHYTVLTPVIFLETHIADMGSQMSSQDARIHTPISKDGFVHRGGWAWCVAMYAMRNRHGLSPSWCVASDRFVLAGRDYATYLWSLQLLGQLKQFRTRRGPRRLSRRFLRDF